MHFRDPVMETIQDQPSDHRLVSIQGISCAAVICIPLPVRFQDVVNLVCKTPEAQSRASLITFCRVVVDHIQDHLDSCFVKGFDHVPELVQGAELVLAGAVPAVRCKEGHWRIAPIVDQALRAILLIELKNR